MAAVNDRGRVPFALVGVLLVVSSVTLTAAIGSHTPTTPETDRAIDGATAESTTALRAAVGTAARETSATPVSRPANTTAGRALSDERSFRDSLELRIYLAARDRLDGVTVERDGVTATASLPPIEPTTEGYRSAIERVTVDRTGEDGAAVAVTIRNLTITATDGEETIERVELDPEFVVATPVLALHDRADRFDERLDRSPADPGLSRRLTTRLYPIAWARGTAQYGGAPISNVVGTRHVELAANDALLAEQRATLGSADPVGDAGVAAAGRRIGTTDLIVGAGGSDEWVDDALRSADDIGPDPNGSRPVGTWGKRPDSTDRSVDVGVAADEAYASVTGIDGDDEIGSLVERAHTVEARIVTDVDRLDRTNHANAEPAGEWTRTDTTTTTDVELTPTDADGIRSEGWETRHARSFRAVERSTTTTTWARENETATTESVTETRYSVRIAAQARAKPIDSLPAGRLDGDLSIATETAVSRAMADAGGERVAARAAVKGESIDANGMAVADYDDQRETAESELRALRDRSRNRSVSIPKPALGTGRVLPTDALREKLDDDRSSLLESADRSSATRARLAVQLAYLDRLDAVLTERADATRETKSGIDAAVDEHADPQRLDDALAAHRDATRPDSETLADPAGNLSIAVETAPSYLPTRPVERDRIDVHGGGTITPLATRNVNVFASPHGHAAESFIDRIPGLRTDRVALSTAARTLRVAPDDTADELRSDVEDADSYVRSELAVALIDEGVAPETAESAVETDAPIAVRAERLANGSSLEEMADEAAVDGGDPDRLRVRLRIAHRRALSDDAARPPYSSTTAVADAAREEYADELESIVEDGAETAGERARTRLLGERLGSLPAGLPVTPVPGYWYATANVWYVEAGGHYERFVARADRGDGTGGIQYVRDGDVARIDHAGETRRIGSAERISFRASTAVVVVVPPGGSGVGDTDGVVDERSDGWPPSVANGT